IFLYEQIRLLASTSTRPHQAALALFGKALWLRQYHALMADAAVRWENQKPLRIPYPYQDLHPGEILRQLVRDYPQDPVRDQAQFTLASFLEADEQFLGALAEYRRLIGERPQSKWATDARYNSDGILHHQLSIDAPPSQAP